MTLAEPPTSGPASLESFVASRAPRTFALVEEDDGHPFEILAWGLDAGDSAYIVGDDGALRGTFSSAGQAHSLLSHMATSVQLVWLRPPR
jgi:hypothetical protein